MSKVLSVAIVGGGISGLAAAYTLAVRSRANGAPLDCAVFEGSERLGGKIVTECVDGLVIEGGPESFVTRKPAALALCRELGMGDRLLGADDAGRNYVLHKGKPVCVPASPHGFIATPLLSFKGKLRAAQELTLPSKPSNQADADESLGSFVRRRFGDEVLERLAAPAVGSIYLSDVDQLSTRVSFERFLQLEQTHGSVLKGMLAMRRAVRRQAKQTAAPKPPPFVTLPGGLGELVDALANHLREMGCDVRAGVRARRLDKLEGGLYALTFANGETCRAQAVVLAVPAFAMAELIAPHAAETAAKLRSVRYMDVATITLVYPRNAIAKRLDGFGVVVPERESSPLLACEVMSNKWPGRGAPDRVVLRVFVGGHRNEAIVAQPDDALVEMAHREVARIFGIAASPQLSRAHRWQPGNPQYPVGYLDDLAQVEATLKVTLPNVFLTGAGMRGLGIPDCVRQAQETAAQVLAALKVNIATPYEERIPA